MGQVWCRVQVSLFSCGDESLEFLEPILYQGQLGHKCDFVFLAFHHKKPLPVGRHVPTPYRGAAAIAWFLKKKPRFAGGKPTICRIHIYGPYLVMPPIEKPFSILSPQRMSASSIRYLVFQI